MNRPKPRLCPRQREGNGSLESADEAFLPPVSEEEKRMPLKK